MTPLIKVFNFIIVTFLVASCQKDNDESRPYEFGFTIDGQQHRHESKDVKGIIQGEFGFITADGIYHVTVYATDENGNFKILSMRNIRVSAPLDGSPLPKGAKIESYPGVNPVQTQAKQPQTQIQQQPQTQKQQPPARIQPQTQTTPRAKTTFVFTTQPTIKPACGGCGYVTTPKPIPGQLFPFQTPAFQKPSQQQNTGFGRTVQNPGSNNDQERPNYPNQAVDTPGATYPNSGSNYPAPGGSTVPGNSGTNYPNTGSNNPPQGINTGSNYPSSEPTYPNTGSNNPPQGVNTGSNYPSSGATYPNPGENAPNAGQNFPNSEQTFPNSGSNYPAQKPSNPGSNEVIASRIQKPLSQVSVSDGAIHVPGNPDIPIRDKYPGMVDGLPEGIKEKDITDLLYKFNYTVGFHGHYEKGLKNGAKVGGYFVNGRDGISRIVTYIADENGFRPKVKFVRLDLSSDDVPKEGTEKTFGLKNFEFVWYPIS